MRKNEEYSGFHMIRELPQTLFKVCSPEHFPSILNNGIEFHFINILELSISVKKGGGVL